MRVCQLYGIPRVGGWDILSQLLNTSPLIHGVQAVGRREQPQLDYLLQLIDRCSLLVTLWPYTDVNGKHVFGNLNLVSHPDIQAGSVVSLRPRRFRSQVCLRCLCAEMRALLLVI
jgi:hypothetical protein